MAKLKHGVLAALVLVVTSVVVSSATSAPAAPPSSPSPDTHKSIPDFWAVLSASVVTKGTLGIGSDLALTAGASNNQVLTVTALERASGCLVQGVWVELYDPKGKAVPRARVQTQQGLGYLGGLRLEDAGLYHLWIYAKDAGGKVVSEGYLPIQVKDRGKTPFETVNGRYFTTSDGATWTESTPPTRGTASVSGGNPFAAFAAAFQQTLH